MLAAGDPSAPEARAALATLCETYWAPVFDFIRYSGRASADDARDLTQAFFARVLEKGDFGHARREKGRFRNFLLTAVRHFLANQHDHDHAQKRGGGARHVPIQTTPSTWSGTEGVEPQSPETPEAIYERRWALATLETAMARLGRQYEASGKRDLFVKLQAFIASAPDGAYGAVAAQLDMTEAAVRVAVHRLRRQFGQVLRATLSETVDEPGDVEAELQYLFGVLSRPAQSSSLKQP